MSRQYHELKILPEPFIAIEEGRKTFEVRYNDRNFKLHDILILKEFVPPDTFTSRRIKTEVVYILDDEKYCKEGFVVMGIKPY